MNCAPGEADEHGINQILFCRNFCRPNSGRCCYARVSRLIRVESSVDLNAPRIIRTKHSSRSSPRIRNSDCIDLVVYVIILIVIYGGVSVDDNVERWKNFVESKDWKV